jgi:hypothetical protein
MNAESENFEISESGEEVTYWKLIKNARFTMAALGSALCYF